MVFIAKAQPDVPLVVFFAAGLGKWTYKYSLSSSGWIPRRCFRVCFLAEAWHLRRILLIVARRAAACASCCFLLVSPSHSSPSFWSFRLSRYLHWDCLLYRVLGKDGKYSAESKWGFQRQCPFLKFFARSWVQCYCRAGSRCSGHLRYIPGAPCSQHWWGSCGPAPGLLSGTWLTRCARKAALGRAPFHFLG